MNLTFIKKIKSKFTKPKLIFYSEYPEITDVYPIYPAKDYKRKWVKNCATAFQKYRKVTDGRATTLTATKCPGIRSVMEAGYIVQTWHDFTVETNADGFKIFYPSALDQTLEKFKFANVKINTFDTHVGPMKIPTGRNHHHIFKIFVPYHFDIPEGYELLIMPVQYDDDPKFTACMGKAEGFQVDLNIHVFWHEKEGRVTIPAGTPLCQLVPVKKETVDFELRTVDDDTRRKASKMILEKTNKFIL